MSKFGENVGHGSTPGSLGKQTMEESQREKPNTQCANWRSHVVHGCNFDAGDSAVYMLTSSDVLSHY